MRQDPLGKLKRLKSDHLIKCDPSGFNNILFTIGLLICNVMAIAQQKPAYRIFSSEGKEVKYTDMVSGLTRAEVVFFGELHNNPIAHWLELETANSLYESNGNLVLALEMFEADDQIVLNEFVNGTIEENHLMSEAKVWDNYKTDYKPLMDFAKAKKLKIVASNIPRRYANLVYKKGLTALDSLSPEAQSWIAPLPIEVDLEQRGYKDMVSQMKGHGGSPENLAISQAVKDATMAHFILKNSTPGNVLFHVNGAYHSQDGEGIIWYIKRLRPETRIATIHVAEQNEIDKLDRENIAKADFIICVPENMTKTF
jgi:uncharacterized iron-regulated protein